MAVNNIYSHKNVNTEYFKLKLILYLYWKDEGWEVYVGGEKDNLSSSNKNVEIMSKIQKSRNSSISILLKNAKWKTEDSVSLLSEVG